MYQILSKVNSIAPAQAMWGLHLLMPAGKSYGAISSGMWDGAITYTSEIDAEQQETTEAQNPLDVKGGDKQRSFSITVEVNKLATGQDPLTVHALWCTSIGKTAPFFLGTIPLDGSKYRLKSVNLNLQNAYFAPDGSVYRATIGLDFEEDTILRITSKGVEDTEDATGDKKKSGTTTKKTASNVGATKAAKQSENIWGEPVKTAKKSVQKKTSVFS